MLRAILQRSFFENPLVGRQLSTHLTGPRLGLIFTLVSGTLFALNVIIFWTLFEAWRGWASVGAILHSSNFFSLYALLALLLPLRVAGAIDGPRFDKSFDQVVMTGLSPWRLHAGNWLLALLYVAAIFLVSLPFEIYAYTLGGVPAAEIVGAYGMLALYSNVIIGATLALCVLEREWVAVPAAIAAFWVLGSLSSAPLPEALGELSPVRCLVRQSWFVSDIRSSYVATAYLEDPAVFFAIVPAGVYRVALWGILLVPCVIWLLLGPSHRFTPGLNNFGNVVLRGDRKRSRFRKLRFALARRVEVSFFYENRPRWIEGWDFLLRSSIVLLGVVFFWGGGLGLIFGGKVTFNVMPGHNTPFYNDEMGPTCVATLATPVLIVILFLLQSTRTTNAWRTRLWGLEVPRPWLLSACVLLLLGGFLGLSRDTLERGVTDARQALTAARESLTPLEGEEPSVEVVMPAPDPGQLPDPRQRFQQRLRQLDVAEKSLLKYGKDWWELTVSLALFLWNLHLFGKLVSRLVRSALWARLLVLLFGLGLFLGPVPIMAGIFERWIPARFFPLVFPTPLVLGLSRDSFFVRFAKSISFDIEGVYGRHMECQLGICALLVAALFLAAIVSWIRKPAVRKGAPIAPVSCLAAVFCLATVLGFGTSSTSGASAQDLPPPEKVLPVEVEVTNCFQGFRFDDGVEFLTLVLRNKTAQTIRGKFRFKSRWQQESPPIPFEVPPQTATVVRPSGGDFRYLGLLNQGGWILFEAPEGQLSVDVSAVSTTVGPSRRSGRKATSDEESFLLIDDLGRLPGLGSKEYGGESGIWVKCQPLYLPEEASFYEGADAVFVGGTDLSRWTERQREALHDYVRAGGSVIFFGPLDRGSLKGAGPWERLLAARASSRIVRDNAELVVEELEDSFPRWILPASGDSPRVPLLSVRSVGPGHVSHLSFDLLSRRMPETLGKATELVKEFASQVPRSSFPASLGNYGRSRYEMLDMSSFFAVLGYFGAYVLLIGPGLFIAFRTRRRRRWLPVAVAALSLAFVLGLFGLNAFFHLRPSYASFTRAAFFGPGARQGVAFGLLEVRSSGRQSHQLELKGAAVSGGFSGAVWTDLAIWQDSWDPYPGWGGRAGSLVPLGRRDSFELRLVPWGLGNVRLVADISRDQAIEGRAVYVAATGTLSVEAEGLPRLEEPFRGMIWGTNLSQSQSQDDNAVARVIESSDVAGGHLRVEANVKEHLVGGRGTMIPTLATAEGYLQIQLRGTRAVYLVLPIKDVELDVTSSDLAFERETDDRTLGVDSVRQGGRVIERRYRQSPLGDGLVAEVVVRDGKLYRSFRTSVLIQELPLEIR